jgi:hypothetical protein
MLVVVNHTLLVGFLHKREIAEPGIVDEHINTGGDMAKQANPPRTELLRGRQRHFRSALLHVIALARYALSYTRG